MDPLNAAQIERAADALAAGELVAFPTETVYGLGARADDDLAVQRIFEAKGRPADHPLIVHVVDAHAAEVFAPALPDVARRLMQAFWPGPVTVIVHRRPDVATACAAGQDTIGLRCPSHPMAKELLRRAFHKGVPGVAAPSANRFGRVSPTTAEHVRQEFGSHLLVLDGGPCEVGIESTIIDCSRGHPVLLRPGVLTRQALERAAGARMGEPDAHAPRASGSLESHYAPASRVRLMSRDALVRAWGDPGHERVALYSFEKSPGTAPWAGLWQPMARDPVAAAHELFAVLRDLDERLQSGGGGEIWVQEPPEQPEWEGVRDRLKRAAA
jgi:L-threonylcarbamoyladenylate synthase